MAGYVTSTRSLQQDEYPWRYINKSTGATVASGHLLTPAALKPAQTTTSFRTGGKEPDGDLELLSSTSLGSVFKVLAKEERSHRSTSDTGHTFATSSGHFSCSHKSVTVSRAGSTNRTWVGPLVPSTSGHHFTPAYPTLSIPSDLTALGTKAIAETIPTNPSVNLATALAELLREGVPLHSGLEVLQSRVANRNLKAAGGSYLNEVFGWLPLYRDLCRSGQASLSAMTTLRQLLRDSGRNVRRRRDYGTSTTSTQSFIGSGVVTDPTATGNNGFGQLIPLNPRPSSETLVASRRIWFSGAYTYCLELDPSILRKMDSAIDRFNRIYGLEVTPETLWNLAPWSWFGDWLGDVGSILHNVDAFSQHGLVLRYGYLMSTTTSVHTMTLRGVPDYLGNSLGDPTAVYTSVRKDRVRATPYGFGLTPSSFNSAQWAILAALGMTKTPDSLRIL